MFAWSCVHPTHTAQLPCARHVLSSVEPCPAGPTPPQRTPDPRHALCRNTAARPTENWAAYVDGPDGHGIGVYVPLANTLTSYRRGPDNSTRPSDTSYLAMTTRFAITPGFNFSYDAFFTVGRLPQIRAAFQRIAAASNNVGAAGAASSAPPASPGAEAPRGVTSPNTTQAPDLQVLPSPLPAPPATSPLLNTLLNTLFFNTVGR